jgi:type IV secretion system protein VirB3
MRGVPIHRFGVRPNLFLGGDRELVMFFGLVALALAYSAMNIQTAIFSVGLWVVALFLLRWMAKVDPLMRFIFLRHSKYKRYYAAKSMPWHENTRNYK